MGFWRMMLRMLVGFFFFGHGTQKLFGWFGWFGGKGLAETEKGFAKLGLKPARENAIAAGLTEAGGGAMLAVGLETPLAAAVLTATMLTAIKRVHLQNGPWNTNGGYEYNAVLIAALLMLVEVGPGKLSLDRALGRSRSGFGWAGLALGGGALGAYAVDALAERKLPAVPWLENAPASETSERLAV